MTKQVHNKYCKRCGTGFYAFPYHFDTREFCSTNCANKTNSSKQRITKRQRAKQNLTSDKEWRYNLLYVEWRNYCISRDKSQCQRCSKILKATQIIVHHIKSWEHYPKLRYDIDNGEVLCRSCHNIKHILPSRKKRSGF